MRLFLVRHGQTVWNATNRAQGHMDVELDETGRRQAGLLARHLAAQGVKRILTSDLARCLQTVEPLTVLTGLRPEPRPDLRERTFGDMEGFDYTDVHAWMRDEAERLRCKDWEVCPPNGESMAQVRARLAAVEDVIRAERENLVVVSHGGALAQLLGRLVSGTPETPRTFRFSNCGVTELGHRPDGSLLLRSFDDCRHLEEREAANLA